MVGETIQDPVLSRIKCRIRKNRCSSWAKRHYKGVSHKVAVEKAIICNSDRVVPSETQRKILIKSVPDDIHCGIASTQKG